MASLERTHQGSVSESSDADSSTRPARLSRKNLGSTALPLHYAGGETEAWSGNQNPAPLGTTPGPWCQAAQQDPPYLAPEALYPEEMRTTWLRERAEPSPPK